jgi:hypothetical protein
MKKKKADAVKLQKIEEDITIRPNYFAGQYLLEEDFKSEQNYHIDRQRSHNRLLHISGIAKGLKVSKNKDLKVSVAAGTAFDSQGRQIILLKDKTVDLEIEAYNKKTIEDGDYILSIKYSEELTEQQGDEKFTNTRVQEKPEFVLSKSPNKDCDNILLAGLNIQDKEVKNIATENREYSGINLPNDDGKGVTLRVKSKEPKMAILEGSLRITGDLNVVGVCSLKGKLTYISQTLHVNGSLGIGVSPIYVTRIVNSISDERLKTEKEKVESLLTVKGVVDYADTKANKNGGSEVDFNAANLSVETLSINTGVTLSATGGKEKLAILDGSIDMTGNMRIFGTVGISANANVGGDLQIGKSLQIGNAKVSKAVKRIVNTINEDDKHDPGYETSLPTVKAAVDYAETKAKKNGESKENFNASTISVNKLQIGKKDVGAIKEKIEGEDDEAIPTSGAVERYVKEALKSVKKEYSNREERIQSAYGMRRGKQNIYLKSQLDDNYEQVYMSDEGNDQSHWVIIDLGEYIK